MKRLALALALVLVAGRAHAGPATFEWTAWIGAGVGVAKQLEEDRSTVFGFRVGAAFDLDVVQIYNPWHYGGKFDIRCGPWIVGEARPDAQYIAGGLALDLGQTRHASFGTYTLRFGGGYDFTGHNNIAQFSFLGGVRYVPRRFSSSDDDHGHPSVAFASGIRMFGTLTSDFGGSSSLVIGIELEPTWAIPPYSLHKLGGVND